MTKLSFPEHMRRMQAGLEELLAECQKRDSRVDVVILRFRDGLVSAGALQGNYEIGYGMGDDADDAGIELLHNLNGTSPPPF